MERQRRKMIEEQQRRDMEEQKVLMQRKVSDHLDHLLQAAVLLVDVNIGILSDCDLTWVDVYK